MRNNRGMTHTISFKLFVLIFFLITAIGSTIGITNYTFAKKELIASGKLDLSHLTDSATEVLNILNTEVTKGTMTKEEAQEKARSILIGPASNNNSLLYDYSQSNFVYKNEGYLFAYDSSHHVTLHPVIPLNEDRTNFQDSQGQYVVQDLLSISKSTSYEDHFYEYSWINKEGEKERKKIAYITYYEPWDWHIGIGAYIDEFYAPLEKLKWITTLLTVLAVCLGFASFYMATKKKFALLGEISQASLLIADGDLTMEKLPESNDEIGQLGTSFNQMTQNIRSLLLNLKQTSETLHTSASDLSAVSEHTSEISDDIGVAMTEITTGTTNQASSLEETNKNLVFLTTSIEKMNNENQHIREITAVSEQATAKGKDIVMVLKKSNEESSEASEKISIGITKLHNQLKDISKITEAINNVSQQTNLLALNASIEAARAGEHGNGFAVVAEEVRKLAEESRTSTQQIQQMIMGIENVVEETVSAMAITTTLSNHLQDAVNETETEFNKISDTVQEISVGMEHLNTEIQQVTEQSKAIIEAIQRISAISEQSAASSEEVTASIDEQIRTIHRVTKLTQDLNELSEKVNDTLIKYHL